MDYNLVPINAIVTRQNFGEYLKEVTLCRTIDVFAKVYIGDVRAYSKQNALKELLPASKPKFLRRPGNCPYCDGNFDADSDPNFCLHCGSALKKGLTPVSEICGSVNFKEAVYCTKCGNWVLSRGRDRNVSAPSENRTCDFHHIRLWPPFSSVPVLTVRH